MKALDPGRGTNPQDRAIFRVPAGFPAGRTLRFSRAMEREGFSRAMEREASSSEEPEFSRAQESVRTWVELGARHVGVPVHERPEAIVPPRPDVEFVEGREPVAVRRPDELEVLTHQHGRIAAGMAGIPLVGEHEKFDADEEQPRPALLVDQELGRRRVDAGRRQSADRWRSECPSRPARDP